MKIRVNGLGTPRPQVFAEFKENGRTLRVFGDTSVGKDEREKIVNGVLSMYAYSTVQAKLARIGAHKGEV